MSHVSPQHFVFSKLFYFNSACICRDQVEPNPISSFRQVVEVRPHCVICGAAPCRSKLCAQLISESPEVLGEVEQTQFIKLDERLCISSAIVKHSTICAELMGVSSAALICCVCCPKGQIDHNT